LVCHFKELRVLRKQEWQKAEENYIMRNFAFVAKCHYSDQMRWVGHVACMPRKEMHTDFWLENMKKINCLDVLD
jgi:hypothetical protein